MADSLSGQPLAGASVRLLGQAAGTATDALGNFRLNDLQPGAYTLQVGAMGYRTYTVPVAVRATDNPPLRVRVATTLSLAEVTVSQPRDPNQSLAAISHIDQLLRLVN